MTEYLGAVTRPDGFNGAVSRVYLCLEGGGTILAVHRHGYYRIPAECWPHSLERRLLAG